MSLSPASLTFFIQLENRLSYCKVCSNSDVKSKNTCTVVIKCYSFLPFRSDVFLYNKTTDHLNSRTMNYTHKWNDPFCNTSF